jgi:glycosyltransferase involved in cell wall biosynthesis
MNRYEEKTIQAWIDDLTEERRPFLVCISESWGGGEQLAANDAIELAAAGLPVRLLGLKGSPLLSHLKDRANITLFEVDSLPTGILDRKFRSHFRSLLVSEGVRLVHTHQTSLVPVISASLAGMDDVILLASRHIPMNGVSVGFIDRFFFRRVDQFLVNSEAIRRDLVEARLGSEELIQVVSLGLDFERFDPERVDPKAMRAAWGADASTIVIGMVARLAPSKGQGTFIRSAAALLKEPLPTGVSVKFVLVGEELSGEGSPYLDELNALVSAFHLEEQVVFAGFQQDIPAVMSAFDIFVMPARTESMGFLAVEAMAMECPILVSRGGGAAGLFGPDAGFEEFGLLVRPSDAFDLSNQLRWLLNRPEQRLAMGRRARELARQRYDRRIRVGRTLEIYDQVQRRIKPRP